MILIICIICTFGTRRLRDRFHRRTMNICWTIHYHKDAVKIWAHFDLLYNYQNGVIWMDGWAVWYKFVKDHSRHVWFNFVYWCRWKSKLKCRSTKQYRKPPSFESLYVLSLSYFVNSRVDIEYHNMTSVTCHRHSGTISNFRYFH